MSGNAAALKCSDQIKPDTWLGGFVYVRWIASKALFDR